MPGNKNTNLAIKLVQLGKNKPFFICENWGCGGSKCRDSCFLTHIKLQLTCTRSESIPLIICSTRLHNIIFKATVITTAAGLFGKTQSSRVTMYSVYPRICGSLVERNENFSRRTEITRVVLGVKSKGVDLVPIRAHWKFGKCLQDYTNSCPKYINLRSKLP